MAQPQEWRTEWLVVVEGGQRRIPAFEFLTELAENPDEAPVVTRLMQILEAVKLTGGPHRWLDTDSHDKMEGTLDDLHEARDRLDQTLYRLYLRWDRDTMVVWVLDGRTKPNRTALPQTEYDKIRELADKTHHGKKPPPAATADDFAQLALAIAAKKP